MMFVFFHSSLSLFFIPLFISFIIRLYFEFFISDYLFYSVQGMKLVINTANSIVNYIKEGTWVILQGGGPDYLYVDSIISV
jgi:hypothetical protein